MKKNMYFKNLLIVLTLCIICTGLCACGSLSGKYVAENPDDPNVLIPEMTFDGSEVILHLSNVGISNMLVDYEISGDKLILSGFNGTLNGQQVPSSFSYKKIDDTSFELDGIKYILSE